MQLTDFNYKFNPELIATSPVYPRDHARLLTIRGKELHLGYIYNLLDILQPGDVLICNDTKVLKAQLEALTERGKVQFNLHKMLGPNIWLAYARPARKLLIGQELVFAEDFKAIVTNKNYGEVCLEFTGNDFWLKLEKYGQMPLPPYIASRLESDAPVDEAAYQTVFAKHPGAVAAPTAGLHFTPELLAALEDKAIKIIYVTLHVGAGTFLPIKEADISKHQMHSEYGLLSAEAADQINAAKQAGKKLLAVGTTSLRLLETAANAVGVICPFVGETSLFITPGYKFKTADMLLTNFHLPQTSLLLLAAAFAGYDEIMAAYEFAVEQKLRFYSYGDACLLYRNLPD